MNDQLRETLSAAMDGESDDLELRRMLASDDAQLQETLRDSWADYHRLRRVMAGEEDARFEHLDISQRVAQAIADEPAATARWQVFGRPLAGLAVAATVAAVVVFGMRGVAPGGDSGAVDAQPWLAESSSPAFSRVYPVSQGGGAAAVSNWSPSAASVEQAAVRERFEQYLRRHTERAALNSGQGMVSFARVVSHDVVSHEGD